MVVSRLTLASPPTRIRRRASATRSSSTSAPTTRCCARAARPRCACSSPRTAQINSSLHPLADSDEPDLGRLHLRDPPPARRDRRRRSLVIMGQETEVFARNGIVIEDWEEADAPARRRRWHDAGDGTHAVLLASASDVDDLIPTLVAFQIEWNKLRVRQRAAGWPPDARPSPEECAEALGGTVADWARLRDAWGERFYERLHLIAERQHEHARADARRHAGRLRAHDAALVDPVHDSLAEQGLATPRCTSSAPTRTAWSTSSPGAAREREQMLVEFVETLPESDILREELTAFREEPRRGIVGELPLLRRSPLLRLPRGGGPPGAPPLRAGVRRLPPAQPHRAAGAGADHPAGQAAPRPPRPAPGRRGRRGAARRATPWW